MRLLFACGLPVLAVGLAAAYLAPSLSDGPAGEPILVAAQPAAGFEFADWGGCGPAGSDEPARLRVVMLRAGEEDVVVEGMATGAEALPGGLTVLVLVGRDGRAVALPHSPLVAEDCLAPAPDPAAPGDV